jgi:predicted ATP-grasp superfamily ATP-dependent carboligase
VESQFNIVMRILVLDGNENQAVACVRSLARAGHSVSVGAHASWSKAGWSRYAKSSFRYTPPERDADAFVRDITEVVRRNKPGVLVLPLTEGSTLPLSSRRDEVISAGGRMVLPCHETVLRAFDKLQTLRLAESLGIVVPSANLVCDSDQAEALAKTIGYPVVIKPKSSREIGPSGQVRSTGRPLYARNSTEFMLAYKDLAERCTSVLAQTYVEGTGEGYFALMRQGEVRAEFAHRRLRDVRPTGSGSALRISVTLNPLLREAGLAVLRALRWHGVAMVEFRVRSDGTPVFIEVNGRFWHSLALSVYAGVDFPAMLASMAEAGDVPIASNYRIGIRARWLLGDLRHLIEVWRGAPKSYPGSFPGRLQTLFSFLLPVPGTYHDNFMMGDPLPELGDWLDFAFRRLPCSLRRERQTQETLHAEGR